jgi:hypothetical protein
VTPPPRLFVLFRPAADRAVVLRQGPSKVFCSIGWDLSCDRFTVGQWCKHKLYPERCDLSADGRWLVYFALNGRWDSETLGAWTAVSRAPYLKAVKLWPLGNTWGGGGLFYRPSELPPAMRDGLVTIDRTTLLQRSTSLTSQLARDGWTATPTGRGKHTFDKPLGAAWTLRRTADGRYGLVDPNGAVELRPGWGWADVDPGRTRLLWAEAGVIFAATITARGPGPARELFDARAMTFAAIAAPYDEPTEILR